MLMNVNSFSLSSIVYTISYFFFIAPNKIKKIFKYARLTHGNNAKLLINEGKSSKTPNLVRIIMQNIVKV